MYDEQREDQGNNLLGNVVIGAGLLGAGALAGNYARSVLKNRNRKVQPVNVTVEPPSGQSGTQMRDLSVLPEQTKAGVYERARQKYPDPGVGKDVQYRNPGSGGTDLSMLITDEQTGEIYRRGGGQSLRQSELTPKPNINLSKQNLGGAAPRRAADNEFLNDMNRLQKNLGEANALESKLQRQQMPGVYQSEIDASKTGLGELTWTRNRIAGSLEAPAGSVGPNVQLRDLPPADRAGMLLSEVNVGPSGEMLAGPEYAQESLNQLRGESSRQSKVVKQLEKQDPEFERIAKQILSEMRGEGGSSVTKQPKPSGEGGPKLAGYSEGPVDAQDRKHIQAAQRDQPETLVELKEASAPFARDARNEAIQTANDQRDLQILKHIQRNEDVDLTRYNEDVLDRRVADAKDYLIRKEVDTTFDYTAEAERQAADLAAGLERISNDPRRKAAEGIIRELQAEGRAERDLARFQAEGEAGGELAGLKAVDNSRQRFFELPEKSGDEELRQQQGSRSVTGEELEEVLLGESKVIDTNLRGNALRGGKINAEGNWFTAPGTVTYAGEGGAETGDWRDASTGVRTGIKNVASGPKTPEGAASIVASEAIRKKYENQRPEPLSGPAADVARSMQTLREGMSVEPSEILPSTQVPTVVSAGYEYEDDTAKGADRGRRMDVIAVSPELAFTGDAADAAGPISRASAGNSPPLVQETVVANPQAAAANEGMAQSFLDKAISGGLTQKATPTVEVYETPRFIGPAEYVPGPGGRVPLSRSAAADPQLGPDPSQRLGYARYTLESKPVGTPSTGAMTVGINYAELPSVVDPNRDIGRAPYRGPVQTSAERLAAATGGTANPMSMLPDRGDGRTTISMRPPTFDPRYKTAGIRQIEVVPSPEAVIPPDAGPVRMSVSPDPNQTYAPQALAGKQATVMYPHMRGESLFKTPAMINNPDLRGGPVKFEGRERREDEYVRPISERLGRGDTMQRFPLIRRG